MISDFNAMFLAAHPEITKKMIQEARKRQRENRVIVMSLKPKYAKAIYEGRKNWEFRKTPPPSYKPIYIYESAPVSKITGIVMFSTTVTCSSVSVYEIVKTNRCFTKNLPGISRGDLETYSGGKKVTALRVMEAKRLDFEVKFAGTPPMNWGTFQRTIES